MFSWRRLLLESASFYNSCHDSSGLLKTVIVLAQHRLGWTNGLRFFRNADAFFLTAFLRFRSCHSTNAKTGCGFGIRTNIRSKDLTACPKATSGRESVRLAIRSAIASRFTDGPAISAGSGFVGIPGIKVGQPPRQAPGQTRGGHRRWPGPRRPPA